MGHIFDSTTRKRLVIVLALVMTGTTYLVLAQSREFALVASAMIIQGIVASAYGPGINAISRTGHRSALALIPARDARGMKSSSTGT